jgi:hypothetical protein
MMLLTTSLLGAIMPALPILLFSQSIKKMKRRLHEPPRKKRQYQRMLASLTRWIYSLAMREISPSHPLDCVLSPKNDKYLPQRRIRRRKLATNSNNTSGISFGQRQKASRYIDKKRHALSGATPTICQQGALAYCTDAFR